MKYAHMIMIVVLALFVSVAVLACETKEECNTQEERVALARRNRTIQTAQVNEIAHQLFGHDDYGVTYRQDTAETAYAQIYDRRKGTYIQISCWHRCEPIVSRGRY